MRDYTVLIFPRDRDRWEPTSRYLSSARPDQDGRYKASHLLPGAYYAIALDYVEQGANTDPDFLERIRSQVAPNRPHSDSFAGDPVESLSRF